MKPLFLCAILFVGLGHLGQLWAEPSPKPRVVVLTDVSNEPDDEESLVRFLVYSNEFDVEGLVATTSCWLKEKPREDLIRRDIAAYGEVRPNLLKHSAGFPAAEELLAATKTGQPGYGMAFVGDGKESAGSRHLIAVGDRKDPRPVWVTIWGGANTLAQALWEVKASRGQAAAEEFAGKLRVYSISDQDDAGYWLRREFPNLFYIVSPSTTAWGDYYRATWPGISGDRHYKIGVMHRFEMVDNPWLKTHIRENHGPLGALYPPLAFIMEGDTPSFLGLINNGLGWAVRPDYGGWGGRYHLSQPYGETRPIWTNDFEARDTVTSDDNGRSENSNHATIWRWREQFQNDFAARMDWCVAETYAKANHNPIAVLNGDKTKKILEIRAKAGEELHFSAEGSSDPDGNQIQARWWIYPEASSLLDPATRSFPADVKLSAEDGMKSSLVVPQLPPERNGSKPRPATIHVILQVRDNGTPNLWAYRRAVVTIEP